MKAYSEYKPSSIDWLGEIPSHWDVISGKWTVNFTYGFPADSKLFSIEKNGLPLIRIRDIYSTDTEVYYEGNEYPAESIINNGDLLIGMDGDFNVATWNGAKAILNQRVCKFEDSKVLSKSYMFYILPLILNKINATKYATTVKHLSATDLSEMKLTVPPIEEQEVIAAYLDDVTGKVDALIAEKQTQVEDLRAYRTSLITETVTRGLNPDAPLRPSGIDWLGDIPEHWILTKAKYYIEIKSGDPISKDDINPQGTIPIFGGGEIIGFTMMSNVPAQTIIVGRVGARCGCVRLTEVESWATDNALIISTSQNPKYLTRIFEAANLNRLNESNAQPLITATKIKDVGIPLPPIDEQQAIAEFLDEKTGKIDTLIDELSKQLDELAEYKKAVISEAVTGKVDVRDWTPKS